MPRVSTRIHLKVLQSCFIIQGTATLSRENILGNELQFLQSHLSVRLVNIDYNILYVYDDVLQRYFGLLYLLDCYISASSLTFTQGNDLL